jgi:hypothetical protein
MVDDTLVTEANFVARCTKAQTEIDIFPPIDIGGIKPTGGVPGLPADETASRGYHLESPRDVDRRVIFGKASVDVVR